MIAERLKESKADLIIRRMRNNLVGQAFTIYKDYVKFMMRADKNEVRSSGLVSALEIKRTRRMYNAWLAYNTVCRERNKKLKLFLVRLSQNKQSRHLERWFDGGNRVVEKRL